MSTCLRATEPLCVLAQARCHANQWHSDSQGWGCCCSTSELTADVKSKGELELQDLVLMMQQVQAQSEFQKLLAQFSG